MARYGRMADAEARRRSADRAGLGNGDDHAKVIPTDVVQMRTMLRSLLASDQNIFCTYRKPRCVSAVPGGNRASGGQQSRRLRWRRLCLFWRVMSGGVCGRFVRRGAQAIEI